MNNIVYVLLATYNGEKYIKNQIESVINQSYQKWNLIIRDDGSTDNTLSILRIFAKKLPDKIFLLEDDFGNVGSVQNFNILLQYARQDSYTMFCDQDDVWINNKIEITLNKMIELENLYPTTPLLVYTNFKYVNKELSTISSKQGFETTKIKRLLFSHLLLQNPAYGCTMLFNQQLKNVIGNIPSEAENHDYWTALVASAFGKIYYLPVSTVLYRQHGKNISGSFNDDSFKKRFIRIFIANKSKKDITNKIEMVAAFKNNYGKKLDEKKMQLVDDLILLFKKKSLSVIIKNLNNGLRRQTIMQTVLFYITALLIKPKSANK